MTPLRTLPASGESAAQTFLADVDRHMLALIGEHEGAVADAARDAISAGGKRLRPLLVRAARPRALDGDAAQAQSFDSASIRAAAAVELIHTASLVHDDLLDGAQMRRAHATVWHTHGETIAIAVGDLLFSLAFTTMVATREVAGSATAERAVRLLARAARTLAEGEALQAAQVRSTDIGIAAYLHRCECKTGALFGSALQIGATFAKAEPDDADLLGRFGVIVGTAFQVADDVLDCQPSGAEQTLGKLPGADLRDGTITLPMLYAMQQHAALSSTLSQPVAETEIDAVLRNIEQSGGLQQAHRHALKLHDDAVGMLAPLAGRFDTRLLNTIADQAVRRIT